MCRSRVFGSLQSRGVSDLRLQERLFQQEQRLQRVRGLERSSFRAWRFWAVLNANFKPRIPRYYADRLRPPLS